MKADLPLKTDLKTPLTEEGSSVFHVPSNGLCVASVSFS